MRLLIAGGGTGGHLFPAIAIAREFIKADGKNEVLFVGTKRGIENVVLKKEGFELNNIYVQPIAGKGLAGKAKAFLTLPLSLIEALGVLRRFKPDFVLGVGGYASGPIALSAKMIGIRTGIQEQNIFPGMTNNILGKVVDHVFVAFKEAGKFFKSKKVRVTGNPVRESLFEVDAKKAYDAFGFDPDRFTIFVFGGSLGAMSLNSAIIDGLSRLDYCADKIQILHQTGKKGFDMVKAGYENSGLKVHVAPFIYNMNEAYSVADLIVCRAGATSISEVAALGKATVLVPYPYAAGDHQKANAKILEEQKAAVMIEDKDLGDNLIDTILRLYNDKGGLKELAKNISREGRVDAAKEIVRVICERR